MTDYQPKPGDEVLLTVRAYVRDDGVYLIRNDLGPPAAIAPGSIAVHHVEPAPVELPTGFCARIEATVDGHRGVRLGLSDPGDSLPWRVHADDLSRVGATWYADDDLSDVVVLDPGEVAS